MSKKIVFVLLLFVQICTAQLQTEILLDSLTIVESKEKKIELSHQIAFQLKDEDWERALHYVDYANELAKKTGSNKQVAKSYSLTAEFYYAKDALDVALNFYLKAFDYYKTQPDLLKKLKIENDLAIVYTRLDKNKIALRHFKNVLQMSLKLQDSLSMTKALNNLGNILLKTKTDSSFHYFKRALKISKELHNKKTEAYLYSNLARNYAVQKKQDSAIFCFKKALHIVDAENFAGKINTWVYKVTAIYYFDRNELDSTIAYAKKVEAIKDDYSFDNQEAVKLLYKSYLQKQEYQKAAHYFEKYEKVRDSLKIEEKLANATRLMLEQNYSNKEKIRQLNESREHFAYFIIGLGLAVLLLISTLLIVRYKNKLNQTQLQNDLMLSKEKEQNVAIELKNRELISKTMMDIQRDEIIEEVLDELKQIKRKVVKKETKTAIDDILKQLGNRDQEKNWKEFQLSFEKVYTSFFQNLHEKHPTLTLREKRLCALLKLNLTTKEIAQISGQSFKTIENSRTRLRKKLNLTNAKTDLSSYLFKFI